MTTRADITKQNTNLMASAIKFTDAGRKSYLFSASTRQETCLKQQDILYQHDNAFRSVNDGAVL